MTYRVLVDENLDPQTALFLRNRDHDAVHVADVLGSGTKDADIAAHAREHEYVVLTNDRDFTDPTLNRDLTVVLVANNDTPADEIADAIDEIAELVPDADDLGQVAWV